MDAHSGFLESVGDFGQELIERTRVYVGQLHQSGRQFDVAVRHFFVLLRHLVGAHGGLLQVAVVLRQGVHLLLEEVVDVADGGVQVVLVGGAAQRLDQAAQLLKAPLGPRAQILVELQEHMQVLVISKHGMTSQAGQENLMHRHSLLERR